MRRPTTALALLAALSAVVSLNSCSSSVQPSGKIADSSPAVTTPTSPAASPTPSTASGNALPSDLTLDFTNPQLTGESAAIYSAAKAYVYAYEAAVSAGKAANTVLTSMTNVSAGGSVAQTISRDEHSGTRWAGTITFSNFQATILSKASGIGFCESDTQAYPVTISGDTRKGSPPTGAGAVRAWELAVTKQANGSYQISTFNTDPGDPVCM